MAILSGNVIGNLRGRLGNLSARTVEGRTIMSARPSSFNINYGPTVLDVRHKFAVIVDIAKAILSIETLSAIWKTVKGTGMTAIKNQMNTALSFRREASRNFLKSEFINNVLTMSIQTPCTILRKDTGIATKKKLEYIQYSSFFCAPVGIRTPNLLIRSQMLYPIELQVQI